MSGAFAVKRGQGLALARCSGLVDLQPLLELMRAAGCLLHVRFQFLPAEPLLGLRLTHLSFRPADPLEQRVRAAGCPPSLLGGVALGFSGRQDLGGIALAVAFKATDCHAMRLPYLSEGICIARAAIPILFILHLAVIAIAFIIGVTCRPKLRIATFVSWGLPRRLLRSVVGNVHVVSEVIEDIPRVVSLPRPTLPIRWHRRRHRRPGTRRASLLDQLETLRVNLRSSRFRTKWNLRTVSRANLSPGRDARTWHPRGGATVGLGGSANVEAAPANAASSPEQGPGAVRANGALTARVRRRPQAEVAASAAAICPRSADGQRPVARCLAAETLGRPRKAGLGAALAAYPVPRPTSCTAAASTSLNVETSTIGTHESGPTSAPPSLLLSAPPRARTRASRHTAGTAPALEPEHDALQAVETRPEREHLVASISSLRTMTGGAIGDCGHCRSRQARATLCRVVALQQPRRGPKAHNDPRCSPPPPLPPVPGRLGRPLGRRCGTASARSEAARKMEAEGGEVVDARSGGPAQPATL